MESKNMIGGIVSLAVVVICVAAIMMPILSEYTAAEKTYTNVGTSYEEVGEAHTIVIDSSDGISITSDGEACDVPDMSTYGSATVVYGDSFIIRLTSSGAAIFYGTSGSTANATYTLIEAGGTLTIEIAADGTGTATGTSTTVSFSDTLAMISPDDDAEYVLAINPYVTSESTIIAGGYTYLSGSRYALSFSGTIEDLTINALWPSGFTFELDAVNTTAIDGDLVQIDGIAITVSSDDTEVGTATYDYFLAPRTITYDNPEYLGSGNSALLLAIPTIVIATLVIAAVSTFVTSRRD